MADKATRPLPRIDEESKGYWEACRRHELYVQQCGACGKRRYHPRAVCPECMSGGVEWIRASGKGTVYTFSVTYQNQSPGFRDRLPYVLAYVTLEEGVQMLTNIVECDPVDVRIGMDVEVVFEDQNDEISIPCFRPVAGGAG